VRFLNFSMFSAYPNRVQNCRQSCRSELEIVDISPPPVIFSSLDKPKTALINNYLSYDVANLIHRYVYHILHRHVDFHRTLVEPSSSGTFVYSGNTSSWRHGELVAMLECRKWKIRVSRQANSDTKNKGPTRTYIFEVSLTG
jgi:hypothetical protein